MTNSRWYSFAKAVSWRVVGTLTTFIITFSITKSLNISTIIGVLEIICKIILYYFHERLWLFFGSTKRANTTATQAIQAD